MGGLLFKRANKGFALAIFFPHNTSRRNCSNSKFKSPFNFILQSNIQLLSSKPYELHDIAKWKDNQLPSHLSPQWQHGVCLASLVNYAGGRIFCLFRTQSIRALCWGRSWLLLPAILESSWNYVFQCWNEISFTIHIEARTRVKGQFLHFAIFSHFEKLC